MQIDIAIIGGGIAGCIAAIKAAKLGMKVALVESRAFLGYEITAHHRLWIGNNGLDQVCEDVKELFLEPETLVDISKQTHEQLSDEYLKETLLFQGTVKKQLLKKLLELNVQVLFMSQVAGVAISKSKATGLLLANKHGLQLLKVKQILDLSEERVVYKLINKKQKVASKTYSVHYTMELDTIVFPGNPSMQVSQELGLEGNQIRIHKGEKDKGNAIIEFSYIFSNANQNIFSRSLMENESRMKAMSLFGWLKNNSKFFLSAGIANIAYESYVEHERINTDEIQDISEIYTLPIELPCFFEWKHINSVKEEVDSFVESIVSKGIPDSPLEDVEFIISNNVKIPIQECTLSKLEDDGLEINLESIKFDIEKYLENELSCDILIAGAGTGGTMAALAAGQNNKSTLLVELNADLGGTKTLGSVSGYWHGYQGGYSKVVDEEVQALEEKLTGNSQPHNRIMRMFYFHKMYRDLGVDFLLSTQICDVVLKDKTVTGILMVNDQGMYFVKSKVTVDATGDGDVACFAGAEYNFGDPRDGNVQSFSMWGREPQSINNFRDSRYLQDIDVIDQRRYSEFLRGLYLSHLNNSPYYFANMLTVREGRRIKGEYELNMKDIFSGNVFEDCISVALCAVDSHGRKSSWYSLMGLMPQIGKNDYQIKIPYRCCIPKGLSGILVTAKSISATRDAACLTRMNADIQNLGYACGLAAAFTASENCDVRDISLKKLQEKLVEVEVLPEWAFKVTTEQVSLENLLQQLKTGDQEAFFAMILKSKEEVLPELLNAFEEALPNEKTNISKALAWFGSTIGSDLLIEELNELIDTEVVDAFADRRREYFDVLSHGFREEINHYWRINQLVALLGISRSKGAMDTIIKVAEKAQAGGSAEVMTTAYHMGRIDIQLVPFYERVVNLCFAMERLADKKAIPSLEKLVDKEYIGGRYISENLMGVKNFFSSYLELKVIAALGRCGSKKGLQLLIEYLKDVHSILREFALSELRDISGLDFALDLEAWGKWLQGKDSFEGVPYLAAEYVM